MTHDEHKIVGSSSGFLALCSCGEAVDDFKEHIDQDEVRKTSARRLSSGSCVIGWVGRRFARSEE